MRFLIFLILLQIIKISICDHEEESQDQNRLNQSTAIENNSQKIFVHPSNNAVNFVRPSRIKPTTEQTEHQPGVPPGYPERRPAVSPRPGPTRITNKIGPVDSTTEAINSNSSYPPGVSPPEAVIVEPDRNVVEWLLGLVGVNNNNNNNNAVSPSESPSNPPVAVNRCAYCRCGLTYKHNRIVGGIETQVNEYPWMAVLKYNNRFFCGGSLINNKYVITAGHCVNGFTRERLLIELLDHDRSTVKETQTITRRIAKIVKHRSYGIGGSYNNDIALLELDSEVTLSGILKPVCLPDVGKSYSGNVGVVTGWGATSSGGQVSNKLREVRVPILSNQDCHKTGYGTRITENMLCAGYSQGTKDSCQGDSGGPLHVVDDGTHTLVGIVSWGEGCAEANYPGVYTRVNRYITWIKSNTQDACYC